MRSVVEDDEFAGHADGDGGVPKSGRLIERRGLVGGAMNEEEWRVVSREALDW